MYPIENEMQMDCYAKSKHLYLRLVAMLIEHQRLHFCLDQKFLYIFILYFFLPYLPFFLFYHHCWL